MNHGRVPDSDSRSKRDGKARIDVEHTVVLNVGFLADHDRVQFGADDGTEHDDRASCHRDVAVEDGGRCDERAGIDLWLAELDFSHLVPPFAPKVESPPPRSHSLGMFGGDRALIPCS